jgi:hypothetical protein
MSKLTSWIRRGPSRPASPARSWRPTVERLEERLVPATGGTPNQNYVAQLFLDLTGHAASAQQLASLSGELGRKGPRARVQVVLAVENDAGYRSAEVKQAYQQIFGRTAQSAEVLDGEKYLQGDKPRKTAGRLQFIIGTGTIEQFKANLLASAEFFRKSGNNDTGFLVNATRVSEDIMPARSDMHQGRDELASGSSRWMLGLLLLDNPLTIQREVQAFFPRYLRRSSDANDAAFVNHLVRFGESHDGSHPHQGIDLVLAHFLASDAYFQLAQTNLAAPGAPVTPPPVTGSIPTTATLLTTLTLGPTINGITDLVFHVSLTPGNAAGTVVIVDTTVDPNTPLASDGMTIGNGMATVSIPANEVSDRDQLVAQLVGNQTFQTSPNSAPRTIHFSDEDRNFSPSDEDADAPPTLT